MEGSDIPIPEQGLKILGTPLGHPDFVERHLEHVARKQQVLLDRIPLVSDVQSGWLLLLHCQDPRRWIVAVFITSVADRPNPVPPHSARDINIATVSGLGLRNALRTRVAAFWASWSDCLPMIRARHPIVAQSWSVNWKVSQHRRCCGLEEVWPFPRCLWPSPRSLRTGWGQVSLPASATSERSGQRSGFVRASGADGDALTHDVERDFQRGLRQVGTFVLRWTCM